MSVHKLSGHQQQYIPVDIMCKYTCNVGLAGMSLKNRRGVFKPCAWRYFLEAQHGNVGKYKVYWDMLLMVSIDVERY